MVKDQDGYNCAEARELDIVDYLTSLGIIASTVKGANYWYLSPLRQEHTASFKVNRNWNRWHDFGEGKGGNFIDLAIRLEDCTVAELLARLRSGANHWLKNKHRYKGKPGCYFINFDDLSRSHRCNVFNVMGMMDLTDATESARTILLGLNRQWETKTGDFFVESAINFVTAIIWYLRKYLDGQFCTLPHVIELMQVEYAKLFTILQLEKDITALINPFVKAFQSNVFPQLEGQIASAKIAMSRLVSPQLYYVLSGDDFTLDVNNPEEPKLVCMGNDPLKTQTFGAVLSTYINRMLKIINQKDKEKCMLLFEEFPTISADLIPTITTGRSNKLACVLVIQDESQLRKDYGREKADVIMNTVGNIISGQVLGESAKHLSDRIGRIMQDRESISINSGETSISKSKQLEAAVPPSKIAGFSSGEFAGLMAV